MQLKLLPLESCNPDPKADIIKFVFNLQICSSSSIHSSFSSCSVRQNSIATIFPFRVITRFGD